MKWLYCALLILAVLPVRGSNDELSGTWIAVFTSPMGDRPKMFDEVVLRLKADGGKLAGAAHMSYWPGDASLTEGRIDRNTITFTFVGKLWSSSGYPVIRFTGTIQSSTEMKLTMDWGRMPLEMVARKLSD
jgi:hypothetical protein